MHRERILIAEDQPEMADQLEQLLCSDFDVVGVVSDGEALVEAARASAPDVVVTDIVMPRLSGIDAAARLLLNRPQTRVVFVSVHDDPSLVQRACEGRHCGYVLKTDAGEDLVHAVRAVLRGESFRSATVVGVSRGSGG